MTGQLAHERVIDQIDLGLSSGLAVNLVIRQ